MTERISWFKYVRYEDIEQYLGNGWRLDGYGPLPRHHGEYSCLLSWPGPGAPPEASAEPDSARSSQEGQAS